MSNGTLQDPDEILRVLQGLPTPGVAEIAGLIRSFDEKKERRSFLAGLGHGLASSGYATVAGVGALADLINPPKRGLEDVVTDRKPMGAISRFAKEGRKEAEEFYRGKIEEGTEGQFSAGAITGRIAGDVAQFAATGAAARGVTGAGRVLPSAASTAARTSAPASTIARSRALRQIAAGLGISVPVASLQALGGKEESFAGALADWTGSETLEKIAENPATRVGFEALSDVALGVPFEILPAVRTLRQTRAAIGRERLRLAEEAVRKAKEVPVIDPITGVSKQAEASISPSAIDTRSPDVRAAEDMDRLARSFGSLEEAHAVRESVRDNPYADPIGDPINHELGLPDAMIREIDSALSEDAIMMLQAFSPTAGGFGAGFERVNLLGGVPNRRMRGTQVSVRGQKFPVQEDPERGLYIIPDAVARFMEPFRNPKAEQFHAIAIDNDGVVQGWQMLTSGAVDYVSMQGLLFNKNVRSRYLPDWLRRTLKGKKGHLIIAHNHPSGTVSFSPADQRFTARLAHILEKEGWEEGTLFGHFVINGGEIAFGRPRKYTIPSFEDLVDDIDKLAAKLEGEATGGWQVDPVQDVSVFEVSRQPRFFTEEGQPIPHMLDWTDMAGQNSMPIRAAKDLRSNVTARAAAALTASNRIAERVKGQAARVGGFDTVWLDPHLRMVAAEPHRKSAANWLDSALERSRKDIPKKSKKRRGIPVLAAAEREQLAEAGLLGQFEIDQALKNNWVEQRRRANGARYYVMVTDDPDTYETLVRQQRNALIAREWNGVDKVVELDRIQGLDVILHKPDGSVARSAVREGRLPRWSVHGLGEDVAPVKLRKIEPEKQAGGISLRDEIEPKDLEPVPSSLRDEPGRDIPRNVFAEPPVDVRGIPKTRSEVQLKNLGLTDADLGNIRREKQRMLQSGEFRRVSHRSTEEVATAIEKDWDLLERRILNRNMDGSTLLALRLRVNRNERNLNELYETYRRLSSGEVAPAYPNQLADVERQIEALTAENNRYIRSMLTGASEAGRVLNSVRIAAKTTPLGIENYSYWAMRAQKFADRPLTAEETALLGDALRKQDRKALMDLFQSMTTRLRFLPFGPKGTKFAPVTVANQLRRAILLMGGRTVTRNFLSNTGELTLRQIDRPGEVLLDKLIGAFTGTRTVYKGGVGERARAGLQGIKRAIGDFRVSWTTKNADIEFTRGGAGLKFHGASEASQAMRGQLDVGELRKLDINREMNFHNRFIDGFVKFMFRLQGAMDQTHRQITFMQSLYEQARVIGKKAGVPDNDLDGWVERFVRAVEPHVGGHGVTDDMALQAIVDAEYATWAAQFGQIPDAVKGAIDLPALRKLAANARDEGIEAVFQNPSVFGSIIAGGRGRLRRLAESGAPALRTPARAGVNIMEYVVPFAHTPGAVTQRIIERSPVGVIEGVADLVKLGGRIGMSDAEREALQRVAAKKLARGLTGTGILAMVFGWMMAKPRDPDGEERITGDWPKSPSDRRLWMQKGKRPFSLHIGDRWHSLIGISPLGNLVALGAQMYHDSTNPDYVPEGNISIMDGLTRFPLRIAQTAREQSFFRGTDELLRAIEEGEGPALNRLAVSAGRSIVPPVIGDVAAAVDPVIREADSPLDGFLRSVPFASRALPARLNEFGEPLVSERTPTETAVRFIDPTIASAERGRTDPILREMNRINFSMPRVTRQGMEDDEFRQVQQEVGGLRREAISQLLQHPQYSLLSDTQKREAMGDLAKRVKTAYTKGKVPKAWAPDILKAIVRAKEVAEPERTRFRKADAPSIGAKGSGSSRLQFKRK